MEQYYIHEDNMERLEKKLKTIENKCNKYSTSFYYAVVGEEFRTVEVDGHVQTAKFIIVEVEGTVKHNDWTFIATVDHKEAGNIIRQFVTDIEVPERYRSTDKVCEHCNTKRSRKDTYLVHNDVTDEWKQVGKSCLKEFTAGLSAEDVARYISWFDELIEGSAPCSARFRPYYPKETILLYAYECVKHFGYFKTDSRRSTKERTLDYFKLVEMGWSFNKECAKTYREEMASVNFNHDSEDNKQFVNDALTWVLGTEDNSQYMYNLRTICSSEYLAGKDLGIAISLVSTYMRHIQQEDEAARRRAEKAAALQAEVAASTHVGKVGERISFDAVEVTCVSTRDTLYGPMYLYRFKDASGNVYMWSTGNSVDAESLYKVTGTVKQHDEFRDVKQTFLTRCKLVELPKEDKTDEDSAEASSNSFNLDEVMSVFEKGVV